MPDTRFTRAGRLLTGALLLGGLLLSVLMAARQSASNDALARDAFTTLSGSIERHLMERMGRYQYGLRGARGAILTAGPEGISRPAFRIYHESRNLPTEFEGARGFGFIRRVPPSQEALFVQQARQDGAPGFAIRQLAPHAGDRYVIQYIEPVEDNRAALGLDIASHAERRLAAEQSMRSGQATLTSPITLMQAQGYTGRGFLLLLPIYRPGLPTATPAQREAATYGWAYASLLIDEVLRDIGLDQKDYTLALFDAPRGHKPVQFFGSAGEAGQEAAPLAQRIHKEVFGRTWLIEARATPHFVASLNLVRPATVFGAGAVATLLLTALAYAYQLNRQRRRLLWAQQVRLSTVMRNTSDAIIGQSFEGEILSWNRAAERLFGYLAADAVGEPIQQLLPMTDDEQVEADIVKRVAAGVTIEPFDTQCRRRDGSWLDVSVTAAPITGPSGEVVGMGKIIRDISGSKAAERQLREFTATLEDQVRQRTVDLESAHRHLQAILDGLPSMVGYWDKSLLNRFANQAYRQWCGVGEGSMSGMHMRQLLGDDIFERNWPYVEAVLQGEPQTFERAIQRPDDQRIRHSLTHYIPDRVDGEVRGFYVMVHDITELTDNREKLDATLRESEALLRTIQMHSIYSVADSKGVILDVNEAFCQISGYSRQELIGQNHSIVNGGVHPGRFWANMWRTVANGRAWRGEVCNRAKDGSLYWVDSIIAPFIGTEGQIEKYVSLSTDVTVTRLANEALAQERERLDNILAGTNVGTWEWNIQTGEVRFNERWAQMIGYSLSELMPTSIQTWIDRCHPDDLKRSQDLLRRHFQGEQAVYEIEVRMRHKDGHWIWALDRGRVLRWDEQHRAVWMAGTHLDITERKLAEERLRATSEAFLERAGRVAGVGGWEADLRTGEMTLTRQTRRIYELGEHQHLTLEDTFRHYQPEAQPRIRQAVETAIARGEGWDLELPFVTTLGRHIWVRIVGEVEYDEPVDDEALLPRPTRLIGALQDVTAKHEAEVALREAKVAAEAASSAKSEFLANMSHEIRTPLNAVIGLTYLLRDTRLDQGQQQFVAKIQSAGRALLSVVNDVLDLSKIEASELTLEQAPFAMDTLLQDVEEMFRLAAGSRPITFAVVTESELPPLLLGDVTRIRQILINLLGNAFKFTERGQVSLNVRECRRSGDELGLRFTVRDTGLGMSTVVLARLFTPFMQADASTTRRFGGTGLGLSIVHRLVSLMGGRVSVESQEGQGSTFHVDLPLRMAPVLPEREGEAAQAMTLYVFGLQGEPRQILSAVAVTLGWRVRVVDGPDDVPGAAEVPGGAVLLSTRAALATLTAPMATPLLWWDAGGHGVDLQDDTAQAGVDAVMIGTPTGPSLFNAVNEALMHRGESTACLLHSTRLEAAGSQWLPGVRVLVVDDSDINLEVAQSILQREGAQVVLARHGQEALSMLSAPGPRMDAVLMDVQMPVMDGHEATRRLRADPDLRDLPVIALTAGALVSERQRALDAGADDFVTKPFDPQALVKIVRHAVQQSSGRVLPVLASTAALLDAGQWPVLDGVDAEAAATRFGGDVALYVEMLDRLFRESDTIMETRLSDDPVERVALVARLHKLKGGAGMLGAMALMQVAAQAEAAVRRGDAPAEVSLTLDQLHRALEALERATVPLRSRVHEAGAPAPQEGSPGLTAAEVSDLGALLRAHDLSALSRFQALAPALQSALDAETFQLLRMAMANLDFKQAGALLERHDWG